MSVSDDIGAGTAKVAPTSMAGRALVVAIASYPSRPLPAAVVNDGVDIAAVLNAPAYCGFPPDQVVTLIDDQATLVAMRAALTDLAVATKSDETVVIYFSGHGVRLRQPLDTSALVPVDADPNDASATCLAEAEFSAALSAIKAKRLLVFIDACHSGGAGVLKSFGDAADFGFAEKTLQRLSQGAGKVLIAASRASETSLVMPNARNSVFTTHLLEALKGATPPSPDGLIRVFEIFNYVAERTHVAALGRQHPIFKASDLEDNFPVAQRLGGAKSLSSTASSAVVVGLDSILADLYPAGPVDQDIWLRAGGDLSRLKLTGTGRANWFGAVRTLDQGGGGLNINRAKLIAAALDDYPHHPGLKQQAT